ncbi:5-deoxy-glucuronate isomerase [Bradyrhizobium manausense]|uniref:5-deoxy-glucuronate isomerase n=1 Tax=Bradyrhizobium manausense TaxID=989370 RepID=UPI001BAA9D73|nr:5-deoxy-glucuronate isomerase [Bradyrhizobium manausense]UVO27559.1 5-deoxy-glucuronate isomerase [Bradyrhizobium arachidis]
MADFAKPDWWRLEARLAANRRRHRRERSVLPRRRAADLYYLYVVAGPKRVWKFNNDPAHE